ncbi:MAG TPA: copper homeostasis protein CutC [Erysipelotrichaceae bacterium]|nr:copper homeostasis protein CutC [Erysipelotrichaceae bacterium]HQB32465.1 copper homeostasis protein CutC [Erysipelotrichaceae bacterium]
MVNNIRVEICCGNIDDVLAAARFPIDRIELNSAMELGGLTPTIASLRKAKEVTSAAVVCMTRTRTAGFVYTDDAYRVMLEDARILLENGADGIVFGFLNKDNTVNIERTKEITALIKSYGREAIFHKAFDQTKDPYQAMESLIEAGVDRVLTDGQSDTDILKGCPLLKDLHEKYGARIEILPGGGVRVDNIREILELTGIRQIHMSSKKTYYDNGSYNGFEPEQCQKMLERLQDIR